MTSASSLRVRDRVYDLLCRIPRGCVVTYGELARAAGCRSPRAIGQILRRNPHAPDVPCHRVIRSDLRIGGYAGKETGVIWDQKVRLLGSEGVRFVEGRLLDRERLWLFPVSVANQADHC